MRTVAKMNRIFDVARVRAQREGMKSMKIGAFASAGLLSTILVAACTKPMPDAATPMSADPLPVATPGDGQKGIESGDINRSADPCNDFDEYANGAWRVAHPIPAGKARWSRRGVAREGNKQLVRAVVQDVALRSDWPKGSAEQLVSDHYASCMDEAAIEAAGIAPIAPLLAEIDGAKTGADVQRVVRRLLELGIAAPFGELSAFDNHEPKDFLLNLTAGGLGLPDRDIYLKNEPAVVALRDTYRQHVVRTLMLGGLAAKAAPAAADAVVALEQRLAAVSLDAETASDPAAIEHKTTFAQLKALAPHVDWDTYFDEAGLPRSPLNVAEPKFLQQVDKEFKSTPVATWKAYLRWRLLDAASPWLSKAFADEAFAFNGRTLDGATEMAPRAQRCADLTEALLGEPVGKAYADRYFTPAAKAKARALVDGLLAVLKEDVAALPWMAAATKQKALEKIGLMSVQVGYPDTWKDYGKVQLNRGTFWANVAQARQFNVADARGQAGKPTNRDGWQLPPSSSGAYLDPQLNELVLPAGFLQPPYFDVAATDAVNYGALGAGLAHDMTHAFDATGAALDAQGRAQPWWTDADQQAFAQRAQCIIDQYDGYAIEPGVTHQGKLVIAEALGDQAGLHFAYRALQRVMATRPAPTVDGFTPAQQFFLAYAQFRGEQVPLEVQRKMVKSDPHPVPRFRVNGPLSTLPAFEQAFSCPAGSAMVRPPAQRCAVW